MCRRACADAGCLGYFIQSLRDEDSQRLSAFSTPYQGFVTKFKVESDYLSQFNVHIVGGSEHAEYWIPAERLAEFNQRIVGKIEVIAKFPD